MLSTLMPVLILLVICAVLAELAKKSKIGKKKEASGIRMLDPIKAAVPLTVNEQPMYFRLVEAFPQYVTLAQVAFSALLSCNDTATRNRFDRKRADFVLCTKAFNVVAVIELDDSSHWGREKEDADRDKLLKDVGYWVLRYKQVPDVAVLQRDIEMINAKGRPTRAA